MNDILVLIERCRALGATLTPLGEQIKLKAPQPLPDEILVTLKQLKSQVLVELRRQANEQAVESKELIPNNKNNLFFQDCLNLGACHSYFDIFCRIKEWAGDDLKRWQKIHIGLRRIYAPVWEKIDARDILVAWAAAHMAQTSAMQIVIKLNRKPHLSAMERDIRAGRESDISFWGRLSASLDKSIPGALAQDIEAIEMMISAINDYHGD